MRTNLLRGLALLTAFALPAFASAHEVYVLSHSEIRQALALPSFSEWHTVLANLGQFVFWGFIAVLVVFVVFFASISRAL